MLIPVLAVVMALDFGGGGRLQLPAGETHLTRPLVVPKGSRGFSVRGAAAGSTLVMDAGFEGSAAIVADGVTDLRLSGFAIRGNRVEMKSEWYLPLREAAFADFYSGNGVVIRNSTGVTVRGVRFRAIPAFPLIVNASKNVLVEGVGIEDCGTLNAAGRNNTTGGILFEEGVSGFEVRGATVRRVAGNAIWTHSYARSPRNSDGVIRDNAIETVGRDAIQVGHATRVRVENNRGSELGFPVEYVDVEHHGVAVALDTAGNVDRSVYAGNRFTDVNGQCIDLDGFHEGAVTGNSCVNERPAAAYPASHFGIVFGNNDPGMESTGVVVKGNVLQGFAYGAVFLVGRGNRVEGNRFTDMNRARCGVGAVSAVCSYDPAMLGTGIYLSGNGGRATETRGNTIIGNIVSGFGMKDRCIGGISLSENVISGNVCNNIGERSLRFDGPGR